MEISGDNDRAFLRLIFAASFASLSYELALMRIFSISLWYHFAFMVVSIAMLGIGASGTALSVFPGLKDIGRIPHYALLLAIGIPASYLLANIVPFDPARLSWDRLQLLAVGLYYIILCVPFFCFGLIVSTAYSTLSHDANAIYASDLLGAGAGALVMIWLLSRGGPEASVLIISTILAAALFLPPAGRMIRFVSLLLIVLNMGMLYSHPAFFQPRISPYKPFSLAMQVPGAEHISASYSPYARVDLFTSPAVRFAPGLSFTYRDPLPRQTGIAVDAGDIYAVTDESDGGKLDFVRFLPSSLAYRVGKTDDVLIIEPRAGLALLTAREFGARAISAIDSNPLALHVMREYGRTHATPVYEHQAWPGLARTWLTASARTFDLIDISLMGSWPSASFGFAEDYRFTIEAFEQYLSHLKSEGFLSVNLYIVPPPRTELRLLATLAKSAEACGITDISGHVAAVRSWDTLTVLMKRSPLTGEDIRRIKTFTREMRFDVVYYPGIAPGEGNVYIKQPGNEYAEALQRLLKSESRARFMAGYLFDIRPVTDERPFFHYYLKIENIKAIYRVMGEKWHYFIEEGYLLPILLVQVLVVSALLVLLPLAAPGNKGPAIAGRSPVRALSYFALPGTAYLFIEIAFIQKMILGLENPSSAASTVIGSVAPHLIPWAWAVNGRFSVIAPILAIMLALSTGYQFVLLCGAAAYVAAFWVIRHVRDADRKSKENPL